MSRTQYKAWFISDTHFHHAAILRFYPERGIAAGISIDEIETDKQKAIEKYNDWLINKWNKTIKKKDFVYIIGDLSLGTKENTEILLNKLHGRKFLIRGNHDKSCDGLENYFEWVSEIKEIKFTNDQYSFINPNEPFTIELCHFPLFTWNRRPSGTCHVHGHTHGAIDDFNNNSKELRVDVGFDGKLANMNFVDLETLYNYMISIRSLTNSNTFMEHTEKLIEEQGFRI